ncbi:MAG: hypothetical protein NW220_24600 [Leptolyngbyaceae cyanobacterium bins.349]|nr:hypothetical protein [Leptolyngbyaceae cyanobacterium bins.349]
MARRYRRREFLIDASFALGSSVLLKILAPGTETRSLDIANDGNAPTTQPQTADL